jgi:tetratricopeptide (TPR) repeat protein
MNRPFDVDEPVDVVEEQLAEWDAQLERGESIEQASSVHSSITTHERLHKGLACLKQLNNIRRKRGDTTLSSSNKFTPIASGWKLPCGFGKFELIQELGRGGFGVVFLARDRILDNLIALKMPHSHVLTNTSLRQRFIREARVAAGLQHPHIVAVHEAGEIGPVNYIVYTYCQGITLAEWMRSQKEQVSAQQAASWLAALAEAVAYAHSQGVMHRDLKPANILLHSPASAAGTNYIPKITDFGLAKLEQEEQHTVTGALLGTPMYMAPEQTKSKAAMTPAVDVHALGVLLYEMLAGHPPFRGESDYDTLQLVANQDPLPLRKVRPRLPADLETICLKCLQKDPALRYVSAQDLADDLHRFLKGEPITARPVAWWERAWRLCQRYPLVTGLLVALCLTVIGGVAGVVYQNHERGVQSDATKAWLQKYLGFLRTNVEEAQKLLKDPQTESQGREKLISILPYYDALLADPQTEPSLQREAALLATQAGSVHNLLFEHQKAINRYQQAADIYEQLRKQPGSHYNIIKDQSRVVAQLAFGLRNLSKWTESEVMYQRAIKLGQELLKIDPANAKSLMFVSNCIVFNVYNLHELKRTDEIEPLMLQAQSYIQQAAELDPTDVKIQQNQALVYDDLGRHYLRLKRMAEAKANLEKGFAIRMKIHQADPKLFGIGEEIARSHARLGQRAYQLKDMTDAEAHYRSAVQFNDMNARNYPEVPNFVNNAAWDRLTLCNLLEEQKRFSEEAELLEETIKMRLACFRKFPQHNINHQELINIQFKLARIQRALNKLVEAETTVTNAFALHESYLKTNPTDQKYQDLWITRLQFYANQYENDKKIEQAITKLKQLVTAREAALQRNAPSKELGQLLESNYSKLAQLFRSQKQWQLAYDNTVLAIHKQLVAPTPSAQKLGQQFYISATDLLELQKYRVAVEPLQNALHHYLQAVASAKKPFDRELGNTLLRLGAVQLLLNDSKQAHQSLLQAEQHFNALYRQHRSPVNIQNLAQCHCLLVQSSWLARTDPFKAAWHFIVSSSLSSKYTMMPVKPVALLHLAFVYLKTHPGTSK